MTYLETTEYLFNQMPMFEKQGASGYKPGLMTTETLDEHFDHPHRHFKTIHVAGTNGKGSCSHTIAAILQTMGFKVGLYTSPHLVDFKERIKINGECISEKYIIDFVEQERSFFEPLHPSFFEVTTALAFKYFKDMNVDFAVIEVGLGGRLDCTNIITPIISVITNISFDHTQFLGNTLAQIASEKAGIIKNNVPVIIGEATNETYTVFREKAKEMNAPILFACDDPIVKSAKCCDNGKMMYNTTIFDDIYGDLGGEYQKKNTNTILCAFKVMMTLFEKESLSIDNKRQKDIIKEAFDNVRTLTGLNGRWQKMSDRPLVICDTGHNVGGWQYLGRQIDNVKCNQLFIVFGMVSDKDIDGVLELLPKKARFFFTKPDNKRGMSEQLLMEKAAIYGLKGDCYTTVKEAYKKALSQATDNDFIFVGGSSYVVADFLKNGF